MRQHRLINFYSFVPLDDLAALRASHEAEASRLGLVGTILLAPEGINVALAGPDAALSAYVDFVRQDSRLVDVVPKWSSGRTEPFRWLEVKIKPWIIRFAEDDEEPTVDEIRRGKRVSADELRELLRVPREDVVLVDTRNVYELECGRFAGADDLRLDRFTQFREAFLARHGERLDRKYVFYCTGGVRCEKVAAWAEKRGFAESYQLDGGILGYFDQCGGEGYDGTCFVFDGRRHVSPRLDEPESPDP